MARLQADHINIHKPSINNCVIIFYWLVLELTDLKLVQAIRFYHPGKEWKTRENDQPDCLSTPATSATAMGISANTNENTPKNIDDYLQIPVQYQTIPTINSMAN